MPIYTIVAGKGPARFTRHRLAVFPRIVRVQRGRYCTKQARRLQALLYTYIVTFD